jgi:integrase
MATLTVDQTGNTVGYNIQWYEGKRRRTIYLGGRRFNKQTAERLKSVVENLLYQRDNQILTPEKSIHLWIENAPEIIRDKLVKSGLIRMPKRYTCQELWDNFLKSKNVKDSTMEIYRDSREKFFARYGEIDGKTGLVKDVPVFLETDYVGSITQEQMIHWKDKLLDNFKYTTVAKIIKSAKTAFKFAVDRKWIEKSPLDGIGRGSFIDRSKDRIITMDEYRRMLDVCPNPKWRIIIALARIGGVRCPSEIVPLRWTDINFAKNQFTVRSPKTEQHEGKELRVVPLFLDLRVELERTPRTGEELVVGQFNPAQIGDILERAGLTIERPFDNMRMTRSNEVYRKWGAHCESAWIGHSSRVREDHYLVVLDEDIAKAAASVSES